jgi:peptidoglycan/xylan/chitin deacetylase (PgdA/CDA1 family)
LLAALVAASGAALAQDAASARSRPWPEGKIAAITLGFDVDGEIVWEDPPGSGKGSSDGFSQGRYGPRRGVPKILDLLARHGVRASFFVPSRVAERHPELIRAIAAAGHEIGAHGVDHVSPSALEPAEERRVMRESLDVLERIAGVRPVGYRAPSWSLSDATLRITAEAGLFYSSNLMDDDLPYIHSDPAGLVELPVSWMLDDAAYFWFEGASWDKPIASAASVEQIWMEVFEAAHAERGYFNLTMHPQFIGRPARIEMLDRFVSQVKKFEGVWFATGREVAERVRAAASPTE